MAIRKKLVAILAVVAALFIGVGALLLCGNFFAKADDATVYTGDKLNIEKLADDDERLTYGYLAKYAVPRSKMEPTTDGGSAANYGFENAFDLNFATGWQSSKIIGSDADKISVEAVFADTTKIDRIIYKADVQRAGRGFFTRFRLGYKKLVSDQYTVYEEIKADKKAISTGSAVIITLTEPIEAKAIQIEWLETSGGVNLNCAAAAELAFLMPQNDNIDAVAGLFKDYAQLTLDEGVDKTKIEELRAKVENLITYDSELNGLLNRAEQILDGKLEKDPAREMGTDPAEFDDNLLARHGDIDTYSRNTLLFSYFGTNRQVTGITAAPGQYVYIYIKADEGDPLPSLYATQHWGHYQSWQSGEYKLHLGKNRIKVPNMMRATFTTNTGDAIAPGGPLYLVNPYIPKEEEYKEDFTAECGKEQSKNVKVYIEGGDTYPVFRKGGDEEAYKSKLAEYAARVDEERLTNQDTRKYSVVDVTEIVTDHIYITAEARAANNIYNEQGYSPKAVAEKWDDYVTKLLMFDGIVFENDEEQLKKVDGKYDPRNKWLSSNVRLSQPFEAAYAFNEHIGIQVGWASNALGGGTFGWGFSHELGHMFDIDERLVSECSNNMIAKFDEVVLNKAASRGEFAATVAALAPDDHIDSYWNQNRGNFLFWWLIESYYNDYWPRLDNYYRYKDIYEYFTPEEKKIYRMNATEKQVYLSSLVIGSDVSYYFDRWGYGISNDPIFKLENTSQAFKLAMDYAKKHNLIEDTKEPLKLWYLDNSEWWARWNKESSLYTGEEQPTIEKILKSANGYNLVLNGDGYGNKAHLGYEVLRKCEDNTWKVVGFTYSRTYFDSTVPETDATPTYKIIAYDRDLQTSKASEELQFTEKTSDEKVCKLENGQEYGSISEAVSAAKDGDTIILLKSTFETGIVIDKKITVKTNGNTVTITKVGDTPIFKVAKTVDDDGVEHSGELILQGTANAHVVLDGYSIESGGVLVQVDAGKFTAEYCDFTNNLVKWDNNSCGAALRVNATESVSVKNCKFEKNSARLGGAVYIGVNNVTFTDCEFIENKAREGGAAYNKHTVTFTDCKFTNNQAETCGGAFMNSSGSVSTCDNCEFTENKANLGGGLYSDGKVEIFGGTFKGNVAYEQGAAICYKRSSSAARYFYVKKAKNGDNANTIITENVCTNGSAVYLYGQVDEFYADITKNNTAQALWVGGYSVKYSGGKIDGAIFKDTSVSFILDNFPEIEAEKIKLTTDSIDPNFLFFTSPKEIPDDLISKLEAENGSVKVSDDKKQLLLELISYRATFKIVDAEGKEVKTEEKHYLPNYAFTFEAFGGTDDNPTYVEEWHNGNDTYKVGDKYTITGDVEFTATAKDKIAITFEYLTYNGENSTVVKYYTQRTKYTLPKHTLEGYEHMGWESDGRTYKPFATMIATEARTYTIKMLPKYTINFYIYPLEGGEAKLYATKYAAYGTKFDTVDYIDETGEYIPYDGFISGFYLKGDPEKKIINFTNFVLDSNLELVAKVVTNSSFLMYSLIENGHFYSTDYVYAERGTEYKVEIQSLPVGYHIKSIMFNGDFYEQDEIDGLTVELVDLYYFVNVEIEKNIYNINYQYNGNPFKTITMRYGETLVFSDPTKTLLKNAFEGDPTIKSYHFASFQLVDDTLSEEDKNKQIGINVGSETVVYSDLTINIIVFIEGHENTGEMTEEQAAYLTEARNQRKDNASSYANEIIAKIRADGFNVTEEEQADFVAKIQIALAETTAKIDGQSILSDMNSSLNAFKETVDKIFAEANVAAVRNNVRAKIDSYREQALKAFEGYEDENAESARAQIEEKVNRYKELANGHTVKEDIERQAANLQKDLNDIIQNYHGDILAKYKTDTINAVSSIAETAKQTIDALPYLTQNRKTSLTEAIDNALKTVIDSVNAVKVTEITPVAAVAERVESDYEKQIDKLSEEFTQLVKEKTDAGTAENKVKADAIDALTEAANGAKTEIDEAVALGHAEVESDKIIQNNEEIKSSISALAETKKQEIESELAAAIEKITETEETGTIENLTGTVSALQSAGEKEISDTKSEADSSIRSTIDNAEESTKNEVKERDIILIVQSSNDLLAELLLSKVTRADLKLRLDTAETAAIKAVLAANTRAEIDAALETFKAELAKIKAEAEEESKPKEDSYNTVVEKADEVKAEIDKLQFITTEKNEEAKNAADEIVGRAKGALEETSADAEPITLSLAVSSGESADPFKSKLDEVALGFTKDLEVLLTEVQAEEAANEASSKFVLDEDETFESKVATIQETAPKYGDYYFVGVSDGEKLVGEKQADGTDYYAIYARVYATGSVKHGEEGGVRYRFVIEFLNGEYLKDYTGINVKLELYDDVEHGEALLTSFDSANYEVKDGKIYSSILIYGWTAGNAQRWRNRLLKAVCEISFEGPVEYNLRQEAQATPNFIAELVKGYLTEDEKALYGVNDEVVASDESRN